MTKIIKVNGRTKEMIIVSDEEITAENNPNLYANGYRRYLILNRNSITCGVFQMVNGGEIVVGN